MEEVKVMKKTAIFASIFAALMLIGSALSANDGILGTWKTIDDETKKEKSIVKVWEKDGVFYGTIMKLTQEPNDGKGKLCDKCKGSFKDKPIVSMTFLWGMKKDGSEYKGGKIMDPNNGKIYTCTIKREGTTLRVRGHLGPFYRTQTWHLIP
jgi:uncharacterized protein (DUF2147 family)